MMDKEKILYVGKAKTVYEAGSNDQCIIQYRDTATAFNGVKREEIQGKGLLNCQITCVIFQMLEKNGIPTHMISQIDGTSLLVKKVDIVPLEVIIRNVAAGSFSKRFGVMEGAALQSTVLEFCYKNDELGDPMINNSQILALGLATEEEIETITAMTLKINKLLTEFFAKVDLRLIDFKLEFGRYHGQILLADEISPDTCRLWDKSTGEKMDKDRFRRDMGKVIEAYQAVFQRISQ